MTQMTTEPKVLKRDRMGRMKHTSEQREALLLEYEKSTMSVPEFSKWAGINYQTFATWIQKRRRDQKPDSTPSTQWVEVVATSPTVCGLVVELGNGAKVTVTDGSQAKLVAVLIRSLSC